MDNMEIDAAHAARDAARAAPLTAFGVVWAKCDATKAVEKTALANLEADE